MSGIPCRHAVAAGCKRIEGARTRLGEGLALPIRPQRRANRVGLHVEFIEQPIGRRPGRVLPFQIEGVNRETSYVRREVARRLELHTQVRLVACLLLVLAVLLEADAGDLSAQSRDRFVLPRGRQIQARAQ